MYRLFSIGFVRTIFFIFIFSPALAYAQAAPKCDATDKFCLLQEMEELAPQIENADWRDQTYREMAKTYASNGRLENALLIVSKIENNDTRAMAIRGIGMGAVSAKLSADKYAWLWLALNTEAAKIPHEPSQAIAYTYIAMSQAFAGEDDNARKTASGMKNQALRNKAYGETAEIQAERGDLKNVLITMAAIDSPPYRDKQYDILTRIFLNKGHINEAFESASRIENAYLKAKAIQRILDKGNADPENNEPKPETVKEEQ
jgi:hypothetical protein